MDNTRTDRVLTWLNATIWKDLVFTAFVVLPMAVRAEELSVVSTTPMLNEDNVAVSTLLRVDFDRPVQRTSVAGDAFWAFARSSGTVAGTIEFSNGDQTVTLTPNRPFHAGESIMVILSHDLRATDGSSLRPAGYSWNFTTRTRCAGMEMTRIASMTTRDEPNTPTQIYGGIATDFDGDGWLDIATINEESGDMRMFINRADGTGLFHNYLPPAALAVLTSPNEPSDFNHDGYADIAAASAETNRVMLLLGEGDGTFQPMREYPVDDFTRGLAVLDADGDGDVDIATANAFGNNCSLLLNDGTGVFNPGGDFEGGGDGEWGMTAGDMNADGILDLIVACRWSGNATVLLGSGSGSFTPAGSTALNGQAWSVVAGDVDNDGNLDIVTGNNHSDNGSLSLGDGAGGLGPALVFPSPGHTPSTDLGDLDGDGDFDWILTGFGDNAYRLYRNDGFGNFAFAMDIPGTSNPGCSTMADIDNDGDLDFIGFDETGDVVDLWQNDATPPSGDVDRDGDVDLTDLALLLSHFGAPAGSPPGDVDSDGDVDLSDLALMLANFGTSCP